MSKFDAGRMVLHPAPFDFEQTVREVARLVAPLVARKALRLTVDYDMFLPTQFIGDAGRLRQILTNLVGNAVKFTDRGEVSVRVTGIEQDGLWRLHVTVEDTGIGIEPEMRARVFGEFIQVEDTSNRRYEGTGLGLAITERLVRLMGGDVWVDSEPGVGSCFGFRVGLPPVADELRPPQPGLRNVLLVEPDGDRAEALVAALGEMGLA
ncbi:MAG: hybrid sensor histidine kinase/response regulator, partial [Rhodocyclaceae bacterium]|nr:hybrid sensor histidine kinase/response regulator [Rhodocyclaceae bacterium]